MSELRTVRADLIDAGDNGTGHQDRTYFDPVALEELAQSIERHGCMSPPLVRPLPGGRYQLVAGERRTRAMRDVLGFETIAVLVDDLDDATASALMAQENSLRADLSPLEEARGLRARMEHDGLTVEAAGAVFGHNATWASNRLALLALDPVVADMVASGALPLMHAVSLATLSPSSQRAAAKQADTPLRLFRGIVAGLANLDSQTSMFDAGAFQMVQQEWDTQAAQYRAEQEQAAKDREQGDDVRLGDMADVCGWLGINRAALVQRIKRGAFPQPTRYFGQSPAWRKSTVLEYRVEHLAKVTRMKKKPVPA